ncbi:hypothetical protein M758_UG032700 [Ceratodon purpureus]|nr:hypothetical protein M758_UG032700 [Ceratodon purpureus]
MSLSTLTILSALFVTPSANTLASTDLFFLWSVLPMCFRSSTAVEVAVEDRM